MTGQGASSNRKRLWKKLAFCSACVLLVVVLAVLQCVCPFRSLLPAYAFPARREGEMRIHFLDIGQGDCAIVEFPDGDALVVDAGDGSWENGNKLVRYLKGLAPSSVSMLLTHADSDHYGGFATIVKLFGAETFYLPVIGSSASSYSELLEAVEQSGCVVEELTRYRTIVNGSGAYAVCLSPYSEGESDTNESSTVLFLSYEGIDTVLCGDVTAEREQKLAREYALDPALFDSKGYAVRLDETDILKVSHHGSSSASSEEWTSLLNAEVAIVSCGRGNSYSHPAGAALARLADSEIYRTDELGDIVVSIYEGSYTVFPGGMNGATEG